MIDLTGKNVFITGGGSGIGKGISEVFALVGANVVVADINIDSARVVTEHLKGIGKFSYAHIDVTEMESVSKAVEFAINSHNTIDILINNAGIVGSGDWWEREISSDEDWQEVYEVNVRGVVRVSQAVGDHMKSRRYGKIVNIASVAARQGSPDIPHYSTTKSAVVSWTQSNALQLAPFDINVNAICPGLLWTPMWEAISKKRMKFSGSSSEFRSLNGREYFEKIVDRSVPMKKEQTPIDIGNMSVFLASDLSNNVTGQSINVDGGRFMN